MEINQTIAEELKIKQWQADAAIALIDEGCTIPFIARYRKEKTGELDDQVLRELFDRLTYLRNLKQRKEEVLRSIEEQEKLTDEIALSIQNAKTLAEVEDIYRPFKPKKRTKATIAKEKGLEPLAQLILAQELKTGSIQDLASGYVSDEKGVASGQEALEGAMHIVAENISDDPQIRKLLKAFLYRTGVISSKQSKNEDSVYRMYYEYSEAVNRIANHRILALDRGEKEGFLSVKLEVDEENALALIHKQVIKGQSITQQLVRDSALDAYKRLIFPSVEREIRNMLTERAQEQAIKVFSVNLKHLLMTPPFKGKVTLGLDPAYRTGCKIAVVDETGKVLETTVVYPTPPQNKVEQAKAVLKKLIEKYQVDLISIGNGTASKESEIFVADLLKEVDREVHYIVVSEAGASVYSASKLGAEEFPDYDVALRSAVSIARRIQDPLAELVKIDPKAIGVGQYQHDMNQKRLSEALGGVVEDCVNSVGVDVNTASPSLLSFVSGINATVAKNILAYREENGAFQSRRELLKVPKLGKKAYEQCAGFLRIPEGKNIFDNTSVHPESYQAAEMMLDILGYQKEDIGNLDDIHSRIREYGAEKLGEKVEIGLPTLRDIVTELVKPGRDIRDNAPKPELRSDLLDIKDLKPGMILTGTVRNVIDFGAFVDLGVHHDGLIHISQICKEYIKHPSEKLAVGDILKVKIMDVDVQKGKISLTLKDI
ncbi:Tex family protein [Acetivibrio sp. MSJd-27]|uniref:Tex family protein n=1 Tax=Acetivibrio sp. MSJd-27 TaxID=2841523 RepID=UPI001C117129|nr:RNA-binding transcriptional accessory protein [Acetivibrio sp. MSJd-27]